MDLERLKRLSGISENTGRKTAAVEGGGSGFWATGRVLEPDCPEGSYQKRDTAPDRSAKTKVINQNSRWG